VEEKMENRSYNTRAIIEAGLITALIVVIMLINVYVPIFSLFGTFILPIPITLLYIRQNYKVTLGALIVSAILIAMLYDPLSSLTSSILFGITGITLGYCVKHDKKVSFTILVLAIALSIGTIIDMSIYVTLIDKRGIVAFINDNIKTIKDSINMTKDIYTKLGVSSQQFAPIEKMIQVINADFMLKLIPAAIIITSVISAYLNYIITKSILKRLRYDMKEMTPFNELYINNRIGSFVILIMIIGLLLSRNKIYLGEYFSTSSQFILQFMLIIDGLSLADYYMKNKFNISKGFRILVLVFTVFSQLSLVYIFAALADMIFDFRRLDTYRRPKTE
jgi:uncharacterized protein YybS (DUF2232 family)